MKVIIVMIIHSKRQSARLHGIALLGAILFACSYPAIHAQEGLELIDIATDEWKPYTTSQFAGNGIASEIISAVLPRMGYKPNIIFMPFEVAYSQALSNQGNKGIRGTFPWYEDPQRIKDFYYSDTLLLVELVAFYNAYTNPELAEITEREELKGLHPTFIKGYAYPKEVTTMFINPDSVDNGYLAIKKLLEENSTDIVPLVKLVGEHLINDFFPDKQNRLGIINAEPWKMSLHFIASRRNPDNKRFIDQFNKALLEVTNDGILERIRINSEIKYAGGPLVKISDPITHGLVEAKAHPTDSTYYLLPRGTQAIVLQWSDNTSALPTHQTRESNSAMIKIRVLNGPFRGRELFVDEINVEIQ